MPAGICPYAFHLMETARTRSYILLALRNEPHNRRGRISDQARVLQEACSRLGSDVVDHLGALRTASRRCRITGEESKQSQLACKMPETVKDSPRILVIEDHPRLCYDLVEFVS